MAFALAKRKHSSAWVPQKRASGDGRWLFTFTLNSHDAESGLGRPDQCVMVRLVGVTMDRLYPVVVLWYSSFPVKESDVAVELSSL
jgi:hypothetical protein